MKQPQKQKDATAPKAANKTMENVKYEVAQEMGINITKNK